VTCVVPVEQIYAAKPFKSAPAKGMSWSVRPLIMRQVYQAAEPPPALQKLNSFRSVDTILDLYDLCVVVVAVVVITSVVMCRLLIK